MGENRSFVCCICGHEFDGWGNNPDPFTEDEDAECCSYCNWKVVIPMRYAQAKRAEKQ